MNHNHNQIMLSLEHLTLNSLESTIRVHDNYVF